MRKVHSLTETPVSPKHTPGPWLATKAGPVMAGYSQSDSIASLEHNTLIAGCFHDVKGGPDVAEANARLIAAAPDLLAACKKVLEHYGDPADGDLFGLRAAIAKAEGR